MKSYLPMQEKNLHVPDNWMALFSSPAALSILQVNTSFHCNTLERLAEMLVVQESV